jgi:rubrerythrin
MTSANLRSAYGGESMAHMRYKIWGEAAEKQGFPNVARLFRAISFAEQIHAKKHFSTMKGVEGDYLVASMGGFGIGSTSENLQGAISGEIFEITEMYPSYIEVANLQEEKKAEQSFFYAISAEKIHAEMFQEAKKAVDAGGDPKLGPVHVCNVCGHTVEGEIPDKCPICGVGRKEYTTFE